jgi:O-antigen ligase
VKAILLGAVIGVLVALDPFVTVRLLNYSVFDGLRNLPFAISVSMALVIAFALVLRPYMVGLATWAVFDYWRAFPPLFLLAYQFSGVRAGPLDAAAVVIGVFTLVLLAGSFIRGERQKFVSTPFNVLNAAMAACILFSLIAEFRIYGFLKSLKAILLFFLLVNFLPREDVARSFLRWLIVLAMLTAVFGWVQEAAWLGFQQILSIAPEEGLKRSFETHFGIPIFRVPGMMISYGALATYMATAIVLTVSSMLWPSSNPLLPRWALWTSLVLCGSALLLTIAKPVMIGLCVSLGLLLAMHRPMRVLPLAAAGLVGVLALAVTIMIVPGNFDTALRVADEIPRSEQERIRLDRDSIEGVMHSPYTWFGRGVGAGARYTGHVLRWPAHNAFILVTAELGLVGLAVYLMIYGLIFIRAVALNIAIRDGPYLPVARGLLAALVVVMVSVQFEAAYLDVFVWSLFATIESVWIRTQYQWRASGSAAATPVSSA